MSMTPDEWTAEVRHRIATNEGCRPTLYLDSVGIPTIGIGFNLNRQDAQSALFAAGCPNPLAVMNGTASLTQPMIDALFSYSLRPILSEARASLPVGAFDALSDARRFVICDMIFNLGSEGWMGFAATRQTIGRAQSMVKSNPATAHTMFGQAADRMTNSAWFTQVGNRAKRNVAMMRTSGFCSPTGDGSDIL